MIGEPVTEAPGNGGHNYNGSKIVKFLVGCRPPAPGQKDTMKFPGIGFGLFLRSLGPMGQETVSSRQFLWDVGPPKGNRGMQRFPRARQRLALECKGRRELDCKPHPSSRDKRRFSTSMSALRHLSCGMFQGLVCSPIKAVCELGLEHHETVRSISGVGVRALRGPFPSPLWSPKAWFQKLLDIMAHSL
ncbi:hypothetical protein GOBAR_DD07449 [Gossypium barbadense]|nr:hypothetical protein GOBAR_DD07449 [Gossypium barbadense]